MEDNPLLEIDPPVPEKPAKAFPSRILSVLIPLAFVLGLGSGYLLWGRGSANAAQATAAADSAGGQSPAAAQATSAGEQQVTRYDVPVDDDPSLGPENAAITIIEFSDFECPFCTRWHAEVWSRIQQAYPTQVRLVYRDFPLSSIHSSAIPAAEAANCAGEQGAYWEYHDRLFLGEKGLSREAFDQYASELGLDADKFTQCVEGRRYKDEVASDYNYAMNLGVRSTPTFFINGIALVGAQPYEVFKEVIDKELAGEIPK